MRVFISHTSELRDLGYVSAVESAVIACEHAIVNMAYFPAADRPSADLCREKVQSCDVYIGILGTRYGSLVPDQPEVSFTELEFNTATEAKLIRLMFVLDTTSPGAGLPSGHEHDPLQEAFRRRVQLILTTQKFTDPPTLRRLVEHSLRGLDHSKSAGDIPQPPPGFQPRADLLAKLDAPGSMVRALTGMPGVGKTHLAAAYARAKLDERWRLVAWVNAESQGVLLAGLTEVAAKLGLDTGDAQDAGRKVRDLLVADGRQRLLVFDNATDPGLLRPFIPATGLARVIITSNREWMAKLGSAVPVGVFSAPEALAFLAARPHQANPAGASALAEELGRLPLALAQAAAVIDSQHLSYDTYLDRLRRHPVAHMLVTEEGGQYPRGVAAAVQLSLDNIRAADDTGACGAVLDLLAVLSGAGVRRTLIHAAAAEGPLPAVAPEVVDWALGRLAGMSLLTFSMDGSAVGAHRLVTRVIRENLTVGGSLAAVCHAAARLLDDQGRSRWETWHEDRAATRDLVDQTMALYQSASGCPPGSDLDLLMLTLRHRALGLLNYLADSAPQAITIGEPLVADQERLKGHNHLDTLNSLNRLGVAYWAAGRSAKAIAVDEQVLAGRERILGPNHAATVASRDNLAVDYRAAGRIDEAIILHEEVLAARERTLCPGHPDTVATRSNLAAEYADAGRISEAIPMYEQTLAARERVPGANHPDTLQSQSNLARTYWAAGRIDEAIALLEPTLAAQERIQGRDHPDTVRSCRNLADAYRAAGRIAEARALNPELPG